MVNIYNPCYTPEGQTAGPAYCIGTNNVKYTGPNLPNTGIETNNNVTLALQKIDEALDPVELVQNIIIAINQNPSLQVMFCALVNSCAITPTTTSTTTTVIPTTTTTTTTQVGPTINLSISYSDNCGSVTTVVPVTFVSGTNFCDLSPLPVFSGNFAGFPSLVYGIYEGQSRTLVKVSDTILEAIGGAPNECVTCPSTTTTTTTALYSVDINVTELTNTDLTIKLWYSTDGGSTWTFYLSGTAGYPNYSTFTGLQFPAGTNVSFGITDNSDVNIEYGSGLFSGDFNSLCGLTNPFVINNISTATTLYANLNVSGSTFVPCSIPPTTTTTTTTTVDPFYYYLTNRYDCPDCSTITANNFLIKGLFPVNIGDWVLRNPGTGFLAFQVLSVASPDPSAFLVDTFSSSSTCPCPTPPTTTTTTSTSTSTTTTTTTVAPPTYMFPLGTSILFPANACTGPILNYLWSYNPVFGAGNIYYAGTPSGPTIPLQVQNGQNDYYSNGSVVVQIDNSGLSYNQAPCASPTTTTSSTSTSTTTTTTTFFNPSGTLDTSFNIGTGFNGSIRVASIDSSGRTVAGGLFTSYNGSTRNRLARINSNGSIDTSFNIGTGFNNVMYATAIDSSGNILVGGEYTTYNSSTQNRLVRLNSDGTKDNSFNVGTGFNATIFALAVDSNGKILVGGNFTSYNGSAQNYLIRLNSDGTKDTSFDIGSGFVGFTAGGLGLINDIVIDSNGKILIGGNFLSYQGVSSNYLIRLNSDGTVDNTFNIGLGFDGWVVSIKIDSSGKIVAGGKFESFQGSPQNGIIRLNSNGSKDTSFNIGTGFGPAGIVYSINIDSSGRVLVGSNMSIYQGVSQPFLVRINTDGSRDTTFNTGTGPSGVVHAINIDSSGRYIIAGSFTSYNGTSQNYIARLI